MKKKAFYAAEADIPDEDKHLYKKANGRWELNVSDFEGIDDLVSPGLKRTNEALKQEKEDAKKEALEANKSLKIAEDDLAKVKKPGTKIVDEAELDELTIYRELGPVADIKRDLDRKVELESTVAQVEAEKGVEKIAGELGLNTEAVKDFLFRTDYGKGLKIGSKKETVKDAKGKDAEKMIAVVTIETADPKDKNKVVSTTKSLEDYLKEKSVPKYLFDALFTAPDNGDKKKEVSRVSDRVRVPESSQGSTNGDSDNTVTKPKSFIERANQNRSTRRLPWSQPKE